MEHIDVNSFRPKVVNLYNDKPDLNPFDTSPQTPQEALHAMKVEAAIQGMMRALQKARGNTTLQIVAESKHVHVELEGELPRIDGVRHGLFFFTLRGEHGGRKWGPCLIGDECMLISAASPAEARDTARKGLADTIEAAQQYAFSQEMALPVAENRGVSIESEVRGRR